MVNKHDTRSQLGYGMFGKSYNTNQRLRFQPRPLLRPLRLVYNTHLDEIPCAIERYNNGVRGEKGVLDLASNKQDWLFKIGTFALIWLLFRRSMQHRSIVVMSFIPISKGLGGQMEGRPVVKRCPSAKRLLKRRSFRRLGLPGL